MKYFKPLARPLFWILIGILGAMGALGYWVAGTQGVANCFVGFTVAQAYRDARKLTK